MLIKDMIEKIGQQVEIYRNKERTGAYIAVEDYANGKRCFHFAESVAAAPNDEIKIRNEFYVIEFVQPVNFGNKICGCDIICKSDTSPTAIYNITNSVIGTGNTVTYNMDSIREEVKEKGGADKEQLNEILDILQEIANGKAEPKRGVLARFSNVMEKHSWFTNAITNAVISFLLGTALHI